MSLSPLYDPMYPHMSHLKVLCPLYGSLSQLQPFIPTTAFVSSTAFYLLYGALSPLLYGSLPHGPLQAHALSSALCPLFGLMLSLLPLSDLRSSAPSTALCSLYGPLSPLRPYVFSMALCPLYGLLAVYGPSLWPSGRLRPFSFSMATRLLFGPLPLNGALSPTLFQNLTAGAGSK